MDEQNTNSNTSGSQNIDASAYNSDVTGQPAPSLQNNQVVAQSSNQQDGAFWNNSVQPGASANQNPVGGSNLSPSFKFPKKLFALLISILLLLVLGIAFIKLNGSTVSLTGKKGEIVWWGLWEDETVIKPILSDFESTHPNIKITYVRQSTQQYRERLTNSLAKGSGPDVFTIHNTWYPMFVNDLDTAPAAIISSKDISDNFYPVVSSDVVSKSGVVGVPLGYDAITLYVNEDLFDTAGVPIPKTWDEFRSAAIKLTQTTPDGRITQSGAALGTTDNVEYWPQILGLMLYQNGINPYKPEGQLAKDAITFYTDFTKTYKVWDDTLPPSTKAFANGKVAMYFGPASKAFEIIQNNSQLRFKTVPLPQLRRDNPDTPDVSYATYWVQGVWKKSINKEVAWELLKYLSSEEVLDKMYKHSVLLRLVGKPYPRSNMQHAQINDDILGSVLSLANFAKTSPLAGETYDGDSGINSKINSLYKKVLDSKERDISDSAFSELDAGIAQTLLQYGITIR